MLKGGQTVAYNLINSSLLLRMIRLGANNLANHKETINQLNVFPVPDGDTGTNMNLSMQSGVRALEDMEEAEMPAILKQYVTGLLMGARGNSGVILSQLFKGFQEALETNENIDAEDFAKGLELGVEKAYGAVTKPVEGTILTVAKAAATCAKKSAQTTNDLTAFMEQIVDAAKTSLDQTPELLPVLKEVGVVDSGGKGLLVIYEGFLTALKDGELDASTDETDIDIQIEQEHDKAVQSLISADSIEFGYCTEFIVSFMPDKLEKHPFDEKQFRHQLSEYGDSLLVASTDDFVKIHIHTEYPGKVMNMAQNYGELTEIDIENMRNQHKALIQSEKEEETPEKEIALITVAIGDGMQEMLRSVGATSVITGGQTMNPSTEDIIQAIKKENAKVVYLLPNNKNILLAAEQAKELVDSQVIVIPTKSIPQGIGALFAFDESADISTNETKMTEAIEDVKTGQMTYATRDTVINGMEIQKNAFIGMNDDAIVSTDKDKTIVLDQLINRLITPDDEIMTVFFGEDVTEKEMNQFKHHTEENIDIDVEYYKGNQPIYSYILMVE